MHACKNLEVKSGLNLKSSVTFRSDYNTVNVIPWESRINSVVEMIVNF